MVWHVVPQNWGEFVYSHTEEPERNTMTKAPASVAHGNSRRHNREPGGGEKNDRIRCLTFIFDPPAAVFYSLTLRGLSGAQSKAHSSTSLRSAQNAFAIFNYDALGAS